MTNDEIGDSGYTLEEIADYHERGRVPAIPAIDGDPQCRAVLDSMDHLGTLSRQLLERDAEVEIEESWFQKILGEVARESRAGRDLPMDDGDDALLVMTEGAVRGLVRDAGDSVDGVLVERVEVRIDEGAHGSVDVALSISVLHGVPLPAAAEQVRTEVRRALIASATWTVGSVDVTIDSLRMRGDAR